MGVYRQSLEALKQRIEAAMDSNSDPLPSLAREYRAVLAELESLPAETEGTTLDEFTQRRIARGADTKSESNSGRQSG